jgi:hypothetical protein
MQGNEKEQMTIDTSGMKLLELLPSANRGGLLEKMLTDLLTSKTAWYSDRCKMIWKKRVSKSNVLLFQLAVSVLGIKEKESGLLHTPTATANQTSPSMVKRDQGSWGNHMYPTPTTQDSRIGPNNVKGSQHRKERGNPALADKVLFPTPRGGKAATFLMTEGLANCHKKKYLETEVAHRNRDQLNLGGRLNPSFVEFLMGYPSNWTKVE